MSPIRIATLSLIAAVLALPAHAQESEKLKAMRKQAAADGKVTQEEKNMLNRQIIADDQQRKAEAARRNPGESDRLQAMRRQAAADGKVTQEEKNALNRQIIADDAARKAQNRSAAQRSAAAGGSAGVSVKERQACDMEAGGDLDSPTYQDCIAKARRR